MVKPLEFSGNNDSLFNANLKDVGHVFRLRKIMFSTPNLLIHFMMKSENPFILGTVLVCSLG
jgi:hypothetical protein